MTEPGEDREHDIKVGKLRPSQAVTMHGPGAIVDLPELSVIIAGIDHWFVDARDLVMEPRLRRFIGASALYRPPKPEEGKYGGVPSFIFPEYLVCPDARCRRLAPYDKFSFVDWPGEFRCSSGVHQGRRPTVFPARFLAACPRGHLDDFPWREWIHDGPSTCEGELQLQDTGRTGSTNDLIARCSCGQYGSMGPAFKGGALSTCTARQPWMSRTSRATNGCDETPRTILRGASNAYFSIVASALSIPPWSDPIFQDLAPYREQLKKIDTFEKLQAALDMDIIDIDGLLQRGYSLEQIMDALKRQDEPPEEHDLRVREYEALSNPEVSTDHRSEFEASRRDVPEILKGRIDDVIAVTRLREVRALRAFTRIDSVPEVGEVHDVSRLGVEPAPIGRDETKWRPATELRGEGIFLRFAADAVQKWEHSSGVKNRGKVLSQLFENSWQNRAKLPFPGMRYVLLHTLAHAIMRQMSLHAGYSSGALRERLYCDQTSDTAGILIYTAASDSDGSLGGLVDLANPDRLGLIMEETFRAASFCASDPLCSGGRSAHTELNGASCHACVLMAETSCERGNRLLDRGTIVPTLAGGELAFFEPVG